MSHYGKQFILKQEVSKREILFINNMLLKMKEMVPPSSNPFYAIPSDTGLVTLRTDGTLIAIKKNSVNQLVIYITVTKRIRWYSIKWTRWRRNPFLHFKKHIVNEENVTLRYFLVELKLFFP